MNTLWSEAIQSAELLYRSRLLRFSEQNRQRFTDFFALRGDEELLELGCGPGALAERLRQWYPALRYTGLDRDSAFISRARDALPGLRFLEGDACALPFAGESFDVTLSHTVSEHVDPARFFPEQWRVLRPGGVCLLLSSRKTLKAEAPCLREETPWERELWEEMGRRHAALYRANDVGAWAMDEAALSRTMELHGFHSLRRAFFAIELTPDAPETPPEMGRAMIAERLLNELENICGLRRLAPELSEDELNELERLTRARYDERLRLFEKGEKQWDGEVSLLLLLRGVK